MILRTITIYVIITLFIFYVNLSISIIYYRLEKAALRLYVAGVKDFYTKEFVGYILKLSIMRSA